MFLLGKGSSCSGVGKKQDESITMKRLTDSVPPPNTKLKRRSLGHGGEMNGDWYGAKLSSPCVERVSLRPRAIEIVFVGARAGRENDATSSSFSSILTSIVKPNSTLGSWRAMTIYRPVESS